MAEKNIIDGIEYETEPHPNYLVDGKPVYYASNIPDLLRGEIMLSLDQVRKGEELSRMLCVDRARQGSEEWNLWVRCSKDRWMIRQVEDDKVLVRPRKPFTDELAFPNKINFMAEIGVNEDELEILGIDFSEFVFPCEIDFSHCRLVGDFDFENAVFMEGLCFKETSCDANLWFANVTFHSFVFCWESDFQGEFVFNECFVKGKLDVVGSRFRQALSVFDCVFFDKVSFRESKFHGVSSFISTTFVCVVDLSHNMFFGPVAFDGSHFLETTNFEHTTFQAIVSFDNVNFGVASMTPELRGCKWLTQKSKIDYQQLIRISDNQPIPDFKGTLFKIAPNLGSTVVYNPVFLSWVESLFACDGLGAEHRKIQDSSASSKFRRLGELANSGHHHLAEKRFFREELLARRGHEAKIWREVAMINLFEFFSECGLSFWRPVMWLVFLVSLSALFYHSQIDWPAGDSGMFELASYSFANSLPLLGHISDSYEVSVNVLFGGVEKVPGIVRVWAFFQNLVSAVFIFFALLAIRNYFKLG